VTFAFTVALVVFLTAAAIVRTAIHCLAAHRPGNRWVPWTSLLLGHAALLLSVPSLLAVANDPAGTLLLALGLAALFAASFTPAVRVRLSRWMAPRGEMRTRPMGRGYGLLELRVRAGDRLAWKSVDETRLDRSGVLVLGIERTDGEFDGAPAGPKLIRPGDTLILYGPPTRLEELHQARKRDPKKSAS
jgi:Trk K+ transport system NAD-binding subunit